MLLKDIVAMIGCSEKKLMKMLDRYSIPRRTKDETNELIANSIPLNKNLREFLTGSLLGDGHLTRGIFSSRFVLTTIHQEYADYVKKILQEGKYYSYTHEFPPKGKNRACLQVFSLGSKQLAKWRKKWYPNGKKIIPQDIELSPLTCLFGYLEDGSVKRLYKKYNLWHKDKHELLQSFGTH